LGLRQPVVAKHLGNFFDFQITHFHRFAIFAIEFGRVVLGVRLRGEITAESHGNRACGDFRKSRRNDDMRRNRGAGKPGGQGERHGEAVGHSDHDIADGSRSGEMFFYVFDGWHR